MASRIGNKIVDDSIELHIDFSNKKCFSPNLLNYSVWATGSNSIVGNSLITGNSGYILNGSTTENTRVIESDPFGFTGAVIWKSTNADDSYPSGDGGWNTNIFNIDSKKLYRFSVWTKRSVFGTGATYSGQFYLGVYAYKKDILQGIKAVSNLLGTTNSNPYFLATPNTTNITSIQPPHLGGEDVWTLVVGHVWPYDTPSGLKYGATFGHPDSGKWTKNSGRIGWGVEDWIWNSQDGLGVHRSYFFYSGDLTSTQKFAYPRVDLVDGYEPSINELLTGTEPVRDISKNRNVIYPLNYTNWSDKSCKVGAMAFDNRQSNGTSIIAGTISNTFNIYSVSIWFKTNSNVTNLNDAQFLSVFENPSTTTGNPFSISIGNASMFSNDEIITIMSLNNTRTFVSSSQLSTISSSTWHNLVINWETSSYAIYLDGVKYTTNYGTSTGHVPLKNSVDYISLGGAIFPSEPKPYNTNILDGQIGSITSWSKTLTSGEILDMYNVQKVKYGL
jgi:hypothetical protein